MCGFTFVDDSDLLIAAPDVEASATSLMEHFQEAVDTWEGCLRATGGGIKRDKTNKAYMGPGRLSFCGLLCFFAFIALLGSTSNPVGSTQHTHFNDVLA